MLKGKLEGISWCFWPPTFLLKRSKTPTAKTCEDDCFMFPCVSSDIRQKRESLKHLCCDYRRHNFSSPSSKDPHSTHSYSQCPDCFHIHAGNRVTFCQLLNSFPVHVARKLKIQQRYSKPSNSLDSHKLVYLWRKTTWGNRPLPPSQLAVDHIDVCMFMQLTPYVVYKSQVLTTSQQRCNFTALFGIW